MCDTKGVIYEGRTEGMNQWKSAFAVNTEARTLADAMQGADFSLAFRPRVRSPTRWCKAMAPEPDYLRDGQS